ncbi:BTB/POZ domain-containing protein [Parasponia andersonii]|uniref:BTB/POZ domain-containing protein n=1 Tax=Parasponia andersonii TaxID=3476 RepID=A0A2P5CA03_PARAD|nr:BTB/POZ domain-containing protein [Parasponia andersonii]
MTKKRQRVASTAAAATAAATTSTASSRRLSSTAAIIDCELSDKTLTQASQKPSPRPPSSGAGAAVFNDSSLADVRLRLFVDPSPLNSDDPESPSATESEVVLYLHSHVLRRSKYFAALFSDRWQHDRDRGDESNCGDGDESIRINLGVPSSIESGITVLELLYSGDFLNTINSASMALDLLPVALQLLFEDCVRSCVRFLEAVPWTEEEEKRVMSLIPMLGGEESKELLARVSPGENNSCEEMLYGLIVAAIHSHPNMALVKAFVAKLLRDFSSKDSAKRVLERAFEASLKVVKESLEEYSSPDFRGDHNETEAIQRLNLHTAMTNSRHLLWLVERMIELRVADNAVKEWSEQASFTSDLQRAFRDDAWRNIVPGLPAVVLRCTFKLANAVATGSILAARQVRKKLVKDWLPVLIVCKDIVSPMSPGNKMLYLELEETFLRIISTLPMTDAQELLQQCLSFSTRNVEDCRHLVTAFNTWFRRAAHPPPN